MRRYLAWLAARPAVQVVRLMFSNIPPMVREYIVMAVCLLAMTGLNTWMATYEVNHSQHAFCQLLDTLTSVKPPPGNAKSNPSRAYNLKVEADLLGLKRAIGC